MKNLHKERGTVSVGLQERQLKQLVVLPLTRRINQHATVSVKLGRRVFKKLQDVVSNGHTTGGGNGEGGHLSFRLRRH